ncbi:receptor-like serine/threonine-protein kinase At2g45590 [Lycium barbarum]|uniref:receptor-like serine/threonine-protein kinase At2g45590 n=1 Tax=Lycium barbarum TaxID=112863 RepID=UPI00293E9425|nr:receptor-like serine/threonine-protein kinase At2g45590 [Lycium barbarum]
MPPENPFPPPLTPLPIFPTTYLPPPPPPPPHHHTHSPLIPPFIAAAFALTFFIVVTIIYRKFSRNRTVPTDLKSPPPPHKYSFSLLRKATSSFNTANRLGQGGFGSVYKGVLPSGQEVAVKLMDASGSLQGEREFHNELAHASRIDTTSCQHVVPILGYSSDEHSHRRSRRRLVLVYEYMHNGSLQDALLDRKCPELMQWRKRFDVISSIAKGVEYLHYSCDPPIVHGDIKPSNILLDYNFDAKIADFGLAQSLTKDDQVVESFIEGEEGVEKVVKGEVFENVEENGSILEGNESVVTEEVVINADQLAESCSPEVGVPSEGMEKTSVSEGFLDGVSVDSGISKGIGRGTSQSGRDWWWKQENVNGGSDSGRIKDYVMEWIGSEIRKERPKKDWIATTSAAKDLAKGGGQQKQRKKLEWWASLDEERIRKEKKNNRKPREWWKEEFCEELAKKKKKRDLKGGGEMWWQRDEELMPERKRRKSRGSRSSIDWWLDNFSGEFRIGRRNSQDFASGDIPKSGGVSSTPSMRGTVCYIAPEYGGGGQLSEKCDVYSFGVLLLVLVSGRRPLQVTASPMSEFERANLVSWARQLAHSGKLLDLVDPNIQLLDREQALLCITIALLCLQRSPNKRPTMKEIVGMLCGDSEPPHLPFEFSPSPPSNFPFKPRKKAR